MRHPIPCGPLSGLIIVSGLWRHRPALKFSYQGAKDAQIWIDRAGEGAGCP
jgi:hypothetical protein